MKKMNQMNLLQWYPPTNRAGHRTQTLIWVGILGLCLGSAADVLAAGPNGLQPGLDQATGTVEVEWRGNGGPQLGEGETKYAFASFEAFPASAPNGPHGTFTYSVFNPDLSLHRAIVVELREVVTNPTKGRAWMAGIVVEDTKICSGHGEGGSGSGGHDDSCNDGCSDTSHDSTGDDACGGGGSDAGGMPGGEPGGAPLDDGCSGGDDGKTHDEGCTGGDSDAGVTSSVEPGGAPLDDGCSGGDDGTTHDEGCAGGGSDAGGMPGGAPGGAPPDGGCSGGDDGTTHDEGCAGGGGDAGGGKVSGKDSRVGQFFFAKVQDTGSPGWAEEADHITWKWFSAETSDEQLYDMWVAVASDNKALGFPPVKLCQKTVLGGNLVVHGAQ